MRKLSCFLLIIFLPLTSYAKNESYPSDYLVQFMIESIYEPLPEKWVEAKMTAEIDITDDGKNFMSAKYHYWVEGSEKPIEYNVQNTFGPPNAAYHLKGNMEKTGESWNFLYLTIFPDGNYKLRFK